jgi:carbon monoxide dehydrogenase subunit G
VLVVLVEVDKQEVLTLVEQPQQLDTLLSEVQEVEEEVEPLLTVVLEHSQVEEEVEEVLSLTQVETVEQVRS